MGFHVIAGQRQSEDSPESTLLKVEFIILIYGVASYGLIITGLKAKSERRMIIISPVICLLF